MKKLGFIINPIAGMGGRVGLKGTDGRETLERAIELGAKKEAGKKAREALLELTSIKDELEIYTCSGEMGEDLVRELGFSYRLVHRPENPTRREDTELALEKFLKESVDLVLFVGGDGTARDVYDSVKLDLTVLGVPGGVKIYSPVYGNTPRQAGKMALEFLGGKNSRTLEVEVVDIDEEAYREDKFLLALYGYLKIPNNRRYSQNKKAPTPLSELGAQRSIALSVIDGMEEDVFYIVGPGTTTREIMRALDLDYTLLGIDLIKNKELVGQDLSEKDLMDYVGTGKSKLILTPTGGQGFLLGRGNQQISSRVLDLLRPEDLLIVATESKIVELRDRPLLIYTGNEKIDKKFSGYYRVKKGYNDDVMYRVAYNIL